jgi:hypothetical protein
MNPVEITKSISEIIKSISDNPATAGWIVAIVVIFLGYLAIMKILTIFERHLTKK